MAYELHIERVADDGSRNDPPLSLEEWKSIINETDGVRLNSSARSVTNPATGDVITFRGCDGNAELLIDGQWVLIFYWFGGRVSFKAPWSFDNPNDPVRKMAMHLAANLDAHVVGDEGEFYN